MICKFDLKILLRLLLLVSLVVSCGKQKNTNVTELQRLASDPKVPVFLRQAYEASAAGYYKRALAFIDSAEKYSPELADVYYGRALILTDLGQLNEAFSQFQKVVSLDPAYSAIWYQMGHNAFRRKEYSDALVYYQKELESLSNDDDYKMPLSKKRSRIHLQIGRTYLRLSDSERAYRAFQQAVASDSTFHEVYQDLSHLCQEQGQLQDALKYARTALELDPENGNYNYLLGVVLFKLGEMQEAVSYLEKAVVAQPWNPGAHYNLGRALTSLGRTEQGEHHLAVVDSVEKISSQTSLMEETVALAPAEAWRWKDLGVFYYLAKRYERALQAYKTAYYLDPADEEIKNAIQNISREAASKR